MSGSRQKFQLRIAAGGQLHQQVRVALMHVQIPDHLSMTAVQTLG